MWIVHVMGPDDVFEYETEIEALRNANEINKSCTEKRAQSKNSENYPYVCAIVYCNRNLNN